MALLQTGSICAYDDLWRICHLRELGVTIGTTQLIFFFSRACVCLRFFEFLPEFRAAQVQAMHSVLRRVNKSCEFRLLRDILFMEAASIIGLNADM